MKGRGKIVHVDSEPRFSTVRCQGSVHQSITQEILLTTMFHFGNLKFTNQFGEDFYVFCNWLLCSHVDKSASLRAKNKHDIKLLLHLLDSASRAAPNYVDGGHIFYSSWFTKMTCKQPGPYITSLCSMRISFFLCNFPSIKVESAVPGFRSDIRRVTSDCERVGYSI